MPVTVATKIEAARQQLSAAIELFFTTENPIAVHTLTAAAYNVLKDLAKRQGLEYPFLKNGYLDSLPERERAETWAFLNNPENFFKHADRDPDKTLEFNTDLTELLILDACAYFKHSGAEPPKHYDAIKGWGGSLRADIDPKSPVGQFTTTFLAAIKAKGKSAYWQLYLQSSAGRRSQ